MPVGDPGVWEYQYEHDAFSMALDGLTPIQKLTAKLWQPLITTSNGSVL